MPVAEAYARKFGGAERAAAIIADITATAADEGLDFHLERAQRANTRDAHRVLWYAEMLAIQVPTWIRSVTEPINCAVANAVRC